MASSIAASIFVAVQSSQSDATAPAINASPPIPRIRRKTNSPSVSASAAALPSTSSENVGPAAGVIAKSAVTTDPDSTTTVAETLS